MTTSQKVIRNKFGLPQGVTACIEATSSDGAGEEDTWLSRHCRTIPRN